jgi:rhamnose transport system substrate-binding protein
MNRILIPIVAIAVAFFASCKKSPEGGGPPSPSAHQITIAFMPKSKGNAYFIACKKGADEAANELGIKLLYEGPTEPDPARQNEIVEQWIQRGVDAIVAACENKEGIATALKKARAKGIKVVTYDADTTPDARDFFCNQATPQGIGETLMEEAAKAMGGKGEYAIITASLTASNMNEWQKHIAAINAAKFPNIKQVDLRPCDDLKDKAFTEATTLLNKYPNLKVIMAICSPAVPGAAEAVKQAGKQDSVKVVGLGLPSENKNYVKQGVTPSVILWRVADLGYLAIQAGVADVNLTLKPGDTSFKAGRLGEMKIEGSDIVLGKPFVFTKENIDQFDF